MVCDALVLLSMVPPADCNNMSPFEYDTQNSSAIRSSWHGDYNRRNLYGDHNHLYHYGECDKHHYHNDAYNHYHYGDYGKHYYHHGDYANHHFMAPP